MITSEHLRLLEAEDRLLALWHQLQDREHWPSPPQRELEATFLDDLRPITDDALHDMTFSAAKAAALIGRRS